MHFTHSIEIDAPPLLVWTYLEDSEKIKQWMKGVVSDEPTSDGPTGVGSTFCMSIKEGRKISRYDGEITAYDLGRHMQVRLTGGCMKDGMSMTADYHLTELDGERTRLDYACGGEVTGIWKLLAPIFGLFAKMQLKSFLRTLKSLAEREHGGAVPA